MRIIDRINVVALDTPHQVIIIIIIDINSVIGSRRRMKSSITHSRRHGRPVGRNISAMHSQLRTTQQKA
jgi:hypothetical protein